MRYLMRYFKRRIAKNIRLAFAFIGATMTILFTTITSPPGVFAIISNCCYRATNIFSGAYIPIFSRNHPKVIEARNSNVPIIEIKKLEDKMTVNLSSHSLVVAIFTSMLVMVSAGVSLILTKGSSYGTQVALAFAGSCWLILLIFPTIWLTMENIIYYTLGKVWGKHYYQLVHSGKQSNIRFRCFIRFLGLNFRWEVWLYLVWFGISIGTINNYCRALFSIMIPIGHENEFFSLFQITSKCSSWIGTIASGIIINYTHNIRSPFWFLLAVIAFPALIFCTVNVEKVKKMQKSIPKEKMSKTLN
ncbi:MFS general substrate transporter [Gigaspora margarita]|uniref:Autophagy-related protein n=1 Tax=Gigaspora margarita TaxID=4874 RepID=A0A8H3X340_GIGMA|nr:MFS general substrate transporter [Gigaspora margarita]